jgi:hypothetical protein
MIVLLRPYPVRVGRLGLEQPVRYEHSRPGRTRTSTSAAVNQHLSFEVPLIRLRGDQLPERRDHEVSNLR